MVRRVDWRIVTDISEQRSDLFGLTDAKAGSIVFPETSVTIYQSTLHIVSEDWSVHEHRGGKHKRRSFTVACVLHYVCFINRHTINTFTVVAI